MDILVISPVSLITDNGTGIQDQIRQTILAFSTLETPRPVHFTVACPPCTSYSHIPPSADVSKLPNVTLLRLKPQPLLQPYSEEDYYTKFLELVPYTTAILQHYHALGKKPSLVHSFDWSTGLVAHGIKLAFHIPWLVFINSGEQTIY